MRRALDQGCARGDCGSSRLDVRWADHGCTHPDWLAWFEAPLTRSEHRPRLAVGYLTGQVYELPALLSHEDTSR